MSSIKTTQIDGDVSVGRNVAMGGKLGVAGSVRIGHNLKVEGWLEAPNIKDFKDVNNKGLFASSSTLEAAYPTPRVGWWAMVGDSTPFAIYRCNSAGTWTATGGTASVSLTIDAETIAGWVSISSTSELPEDPTDDERGKGYLLGTVLYVWVGTGGDTLDGLYQSAQLKGETGTTVNIGEADIADNLTTDDAEKVLSAKQGKVLKGLIDNIEIPVVNDLTTGGEGNALSAEMGKELGCTNVGDISKNVFNIDGWQDNYYLPNANGSTNAQWDTSGYIEVKNEKQYCIRIGESIPTSTYDYYTLWDANKTYLGKATIDTTTGVISVNQADVRYMRVCLYRPSGYTQPTTGVTIKREHVKYFLVINEGTEIVDRRPYNQLSVKNDVESGFVRNAVMNTVRNLFDWDNYVVGSLPNGVYSESGNNKVTPFIDVADLGEVLMQWSLNGTNKSDAVLFAYDESQNPLFTIPCPYNSTGGYLVPAAAKYVRGYCINLLFCLSVGGAIPTQDYEPTPKIDEDYIPILSRFTGGKVAFLGDSFTAMGTYPRMTATLAHFGEWYNWGTNAYKYSALKSRLETYASIVPSLDAIVILGGANDFASSDGPSSLTSACGTLISYIYSLNPTITILHLTPTYTYGYTPPSGTQRTDTDSNGIHIREYANAIRNACDELGVPVLDTYRTLGITQYNVASMTRDGLHPTEDTYKKLGWQVAQALGKL